MQLANGGALIYFLDQAPRPPCIGIKDAALFCRDGVSNLFHSKERTIFLDSCGGFLALWNGIGVTLNLYNVRSPSQDLGDRGCMDGPIAPQYCICYGRAEYAAFPQQLLYKKSVRPHTGGL